MLSQDISKAAKEVGIDLNAKDYAFLDKTPELHTPLLVGLGGSWAYGTNIETSDVDIRGIAMHSKKDILLGHGFEQIANEATDTVIYSLKKIISLLINCNPNTIELLGLHPNHYLYLSEIGEKLLLNRDMFLSQKCIGSFMGYANAQMYRLQQKTLAAMPEEDFKEHICKTLNNMKYTLEEQYNMDGVNVHMADGQLMLDLNLKNYPLEDISKVLNVFNNTLKDYNKTAGKRNEHAIAHGKIAKHSMHLLRLYMMCEDILLNGEINTYRSKEHDLLMQIRNGEFLGEDGVPNQEFFDIVRDYESRLEYAKEHTAIPAKPDIKRIEKFMMEANEYILSSSDKTEKAHEPKHER